MQGIRVVAQGAASPPSVFVSPGADWIAPSQLAFGSLEIHWSILGVVSAANEMSIKDIDRLAQSVVEACAMLPRHWGFLTIAAPGLLTLGGLSYIAFRAEIQVIV